MSKAKKDYSKERTIFTIKKGANSTQLRPGKGVKITVDGQEVEYVETEYQGNKGQLLFINKVDDEIKRLESNENQTESIQKQIEYLKKQKEYGVSSFVKGFLK